ncbi:MAG TPA: CDP-alcohol phosphatidyltransferase family protein [Gaiellaceae bacterium]|nr:CDP-alcohol phosphatidyltransferase family protein [Gaiellaceae bacterium]
MFERGALLRAARGPLLGLSAQLLLLAALAGTVGLGLAGWVAGAATSLLLDGALAYALLRRRDARLGPADWVTFARATLSVGVAALVADSFWADPPRAALVTLASVALALDFVDGRVARSTGTTSALGARLDGEVDAFLILALSLEVAPYAGAWVLAIGAARYAFLAAGWPLAWMRAELPRRDWRKVAAAAQGVALVIAATRLLPLTVDRILLAIALALLAESFGRDVWWLWRRRHEAGATAGRRGAIVFTLLALAIVWAALVAPVQPWRLTPGAFARLPLEGIVVVLLAALLPPRVRRLLPWVIGPALGVLVLVKLLDLGFFIAFDRPFNPVDDWSYASIGLETMRDTFGRTDADLVLVAAIALVAAALVLPTLAVRRVTRVAAGHRDRSLRSATALAVAWVGCWAFGAQIVSGAGIASTSAVDLAVQEVHAVKSDLRDHARFRSDLEHDRYRAVGGDKLLAGLRGKDVLLVFVESYGKLAVEGTSFAPRIDSLLDTGTQQLAAAGFSARSGWLTSSTFGGGSWLAHGTLQSGTWVDTQGRYNELVSSKRLTLTKAFGNAGWRTVADVPSDDRNWPEGRSFYHYDGVYDRRNVGYRGPKYAFAAMPDQYVLLALQRLELAKPNRPPIFSEVDLVSSHTPWTRIPPLIPWNRVGDGSIFKRLPVDRSGLSDTQQGYAQSIHYTLSALFSFVERYGNDNTVLIVLGDHQPSRVVSGSPGHDVPISIVAHDPAVLARIDGWGWVDGMRPTPDAPVWLMSDFRNRFLSAYGS